MFKASLVDSTGKIDAVISLQNRVREGKVYSFSNVHAFLKEGHLTVAVTAKNAIFEYN